MDRGHITKKMARQKYFVAIKLGARGHIQNKRAHLNYFALKLIKIYSKKRKNKQVNILNTKCIF